MYVYIAHRDIKDYCSQNNGLGGNPANNDYRFTCIKDGVYYLLTKNDSNYAVSKEAGDKFIENVLSRCTGEHQGYFPMNGSPDGKDTAAVIEMERKVTAGTRSRKMVYYFDMDDETLFQMLEDLRKLSGDPLDEKTLMNYCHPNPALPEGDFELKEIYHGIYYTPDNAPASVIQPLSPDKMDSSFSMSRSGAFLQMRSGNIKVYYNVPEELISGIKEKVRILCADPKDEYCENGKPEGFIRFGKEKERIFTDPGKTLELLNEIASKSIPDRSEEVYKNSYYSINKTASVQRCSSCGAIVTGMNFCSECGTKVQGLSPFTFQL